MRKSHKIRFLLDLHGHSARKNIFAYGEEYEMESSQFLHSRILPKVLSDSISSFKYDFCIFREVEEKKKTARIYFSNKWKINCLTFEQSYGLLDSGQIGITSWRNFGHALACSLLEFSKMYEENKEEGLKQYLAE